MLTWAKQFDRNVRGVVKGTPRLRRQWERAVAEKRESDLAQRGHVGGADDHDMALWQAMVYQRSHINAFSSVLSAASVSAEEPTTVVDVGCGAGSVAFAFAESGFRELSYIGFDHHKASVKLCRRMLTPLGTNVKVFRNWEKSVAAAINDLGASNAFLTCSYVTAQPTFGDDEIHAVVELAGQLACHYRGLTLVAADAPFPNSKLATLFGRVADEYEPETLLALGNRDYEMVYPSLMGSLDSLKGHTKKVKGFVVEVEC